MYCYKAVIERKNFRKNVNRWLFEASKSNNSLLGNEYKGGDMVVLYDNQNNELATTILTTYFELSTLDIITFGFDNLPDDIASKTAYIVKTTNVQKVDEIENQTVNVSKTNGNNQVNNTTNSYVGIIGLGIIVFIIILSFVFNSDSKKGVNDKCDICGKSAYSSISGEEFCYKHYKEALNYYLDD